MEKESLSKLLNGVLLKKYSCINDIVVLYNEITPNAYVVTVYVIPVSSSKGFEDCNRDYPEIKNDIIELADSMGINIHSISQATRS
jgi:hypothetical protein